MLNKTIETVCVRGQQLTHVGMQHLGTALGYSRFITDVDISHNCLDDQAAKYVAQVCVSWGNADLGLAEERHSEARVADSPENCIQRGGQESGLHCIKDYP